MIDSRDKRASALLGRAWPGPDGVVDAEDRRQMAGLYRFGTAGPTPTVPTGTSWGARAQVVGWGWTRTEAR